MDISINAKMTCSDGPCGHSSQVLLNPTTEKITHLVVNNDVFPETDYLVPIEVVADSTPDQIRLNCSEADLSKMPVFDRVEIAPTIMPGYSGGPYMLWPYFSRIPSEIPLEKDHIPADELAIRRGARVAAIDGLIGRVDEFLIDPHTDLITHLLMREGHLWGQKEVTIPVSQIDHYQKNTVYLKLSKHAIAELPTLPVHRR